MEGMFLMSVIVAGRMSSFDYYCQYEYIVCTLMLVFGFTARYAVMLSTTQVCE